MTRRRVARFLHSNPEFHIRGITMNSADEASNLDTTSRRQAPKEVATDNYRGVDLAPNTLESLVTWDVSGHAQRERDRLNAGTMSGGY